MKHEGFKDCVKCRVKVGWGSREGCKLQFMPSALHLDPRKRKCARIQRPPLGPLTWVLHSISSGRGEEKPCFQLGYPENTFSQCTPLPLLTRTSANSRQSVPHRFLWFSRVPKFKNLSLWTALILWTLLYLFLYLRTPVLRFIHLGILLTGQLITWQFDTLYQISPSHRLSFISTLALLRPWCHDLKW